MFHATIHTPFGNFAVSRGLPGGGSGGAYTLNLTPIGQLEVTPVKEYPGQPNRSVLDHDALYDEGKRCSPEMIGSGLRPLPTYFINGARYTQEIEIAVGESPSWYAEPGKRFAYARSAALTESAREKVAAWVLEHLDEICTPEFVARTELDRAASEHHWKRRKVEQVREMLKSAKAEAAEAGRTLRKAAAKLHKIEDAS